MPVCLRCRTLVDTNVLLYELCCSVQGRLKAVLLCLWYVDTVAFGAWFVPAWCAQKRSRLKKKQRKQRTSGRFFSPTDNFIVGNYGLRKAERWDDMPSMSSEVGEI